ncbi:MAG: Flp pilus assembly complex ATPase component TadA [Candidatus Riflebacteria bacterium]|nr:Flp pilus assembly complex ATPase component TadA [Candidatus Riflebacteria bacterium]
MMLAPVPIGADALLEDLLDQARARRATDVHLTPDAREVRVSLRVDGILRPQSWCIDPRDYEVLVGRLKVLAGLNMAERRRPQTGAIGEGGRAGLELRVSFLPSTEGEATALRLLTSGFAALSLGRLGLTGSLEARLASLVTRPSGLVLVVGPTGSGKTTTLYALIDELTRSNRRILTVEDPVERRIDGATQVQVDRDAGFDFGEALRGVLRHDPDVIMVGEVRDAETASIAVSAALSGHLVLASMHAEGPLSALERLVHLQVDRRRLVAVLAGIVTQRLVRIACRSCAGTGKPGGRAPGGVGGATRGGCPWCSDCGFSGRTGVFGLLEPDPVLRRRLLASDPTLAADGEELAQLVQQAKERLIAGETTEREVARVLPWTALSATETRGATGG